MKSITGEILGRARYVCLAKRSPKKPDEVFFTIEKKRKYGKGYELAKKCGYIQMTDSMQTIFDTLLLSRSYNRSISFIEWNDCYNVIFEDGVNISSIQCRLEKEEFDAWEKTIEEESA